MKRKILLIILILLIAYFHIARAEDNGTCYNYWTQEVYGTCANHAGCAVIPHVWWVWCVGYPDVDNDGIADKDDNNTIYGRIRYKSTDQGQKDVVATASYLWFKSTTTDEDGYYAMEVDVDQISEKEFLVIPTNDNESIFEPFSATVTIGGFTDGN